MTLPPNDISIGSSVFAQLAQHTAQTTLHATYVGKDHISSLRAGEATQNVGLPQHQRAANPCEPRKCTTCFVLAFVKRIKSENGPHACFHQGWQKYVFLSFSFLGSKNKIWKSAKFKSFIRVLRFSKLSQFFSQKTVSALSCFSSWFD